MNTRLLGRLTPLMLAMALGLPSARAQTTAFTYQGQLVDKTSGAPLTGNYDMRFYLRDAPTGENAVGTTNAFDGSTSAPVTVDKGLFTVTLDFGAAPFPGARRWLQIEVRNHTSGATYERLAERTEITSVPYAITAANLAGGGLTAGTYGNAVTFNNPGNSFLGDGSGLTGLNAANIVSGTLANARLLPNVALLDRSPQTFTGNNAFGNVNVSGQLSVSSSSALFTAVAVDDLYLEPHSVSDATNSYFFRARSYFFSPKGQPLGPFPVFVVRGDGRVGIGTGLPESRLHSKAGSGDGNAIQGTGSDPSGSGVYGEHTAQGWGVAGRSSGTGIGVYGNNANETGWAGYFNGRVGWGASMLNLDQGGAIELGNSLSSGTTPYIDFHMGVGANQDFNVRLINDINGQLTCVGTFVATGDTSCRTITIRGGADLAEPFEISDREIPKGSLVVIDDENAGKLKLASQAYDTRVAGIVSGANGVHPGISLQQDGLLGAGQNVALSGRVYALADASYGAIKPGDLLTSSGTPGHVMKVTDHTRAQGAIVGKAMSGLTEGKGMVLVLVTLQ